MTSEEMGNTNMTKRIMARRRRRKSITSFKKRKIRSSLDIQGFQCAESKYEFQTVSFP
jgi:hypothetical protein